MNHVFDRDVVAQLLIILAISIGGWLMFVHPKTKKLEDLHRVLNATTDSGAPLGDEAIAQRARHLSDGRHHAKALVNLNRLAENTTLLYGLFNQLGARHRVVVQSISPGSEGKTTPDGRYTANRIDMTLHGRYADVANFLDGVGELSGFVRPVSLTLKPEGDGADPAVLATFSCEVLRFEPPEILREIGLIES